MHKTAFFIVLGALALVGIIYLLFDGAPLQENPAASEVKVIQKWELPDVLDEISGLPGWVTL